MRVVGIDFGTSNVRISTWDSDQDLPPEPKLIGYQPAITISQVGDPDTTTMPAVIALRREQNGEVTVIVGEEADVLNDVLNQTYVIRNIKRLALSSDAYVNWHIDVLNSQMPEPKWPPLRWDPQGRCVQVWGKEFNVWDLIRLILEEAIQRASIAGEFEWRAGCPVHADLEYREGLARALSQALGRDEPNRVNWIVEEPILFLTLAHRLGEMESGGPLKGSFLVYDLGGGSFDCALVEIDEDSGQMLVYGADGHPLLGGSDVDEMLAKELDYKGRPDLMRGAKERVSSSNPAVDLPDGTIVSLEDVERTLLKGRFASKSSSTMRDAYLTAKVLWKRGEGEDDPPVGKVLSKNRQTGALRLVQQLTWKDMAEDVDKIILFGGPTRAPHFHEYLSDLFGPDRVVSAADLLPKLTGTPDLELVGISLGACYSYEGAHPPMYVNRLPARVTLEDRLTGDKVEYKPFQNFTSTFKPFDDYVSMPLSLQNALLWSKRYPETYELTITSPNEVVLEQRFVDALLDSRLIGHSLSLVIDRLGRVGVKQGSDKVKPKWITVLDSTPWQTEIQREALQRLFEQVRRYTRENQQQGMSNVNRLPWDYPTP